MGKEPSKADAIVVAVAGLFIIIGSLLRWVRTDLPFSGTDGDGVFTLVTGALVVVIGFIGRENPSRLLRTAALGFFMLTGWVAFDVWDSVTHLGAPFAATVGIGLLITLAGSLSGAIFSALWIGRAAAIPLPDLATADLATPH
jgi:hypothetical protein